MKIAINEYRAAYLLRKNREVTFNRKLYRPDPEQLNSVFRLIQDEAIDEWDAEYNATVSRMATKVFFKLIIDRLGRFIND